MSEQRFEDILDECIARMLSGESWQQVIGAYPAHAASLLPALQGADALARAQHAAPSGAARAAARNLMLNEVAGTGSAAANTVKGGLVVGWISWFKMRPPAARLAAVGAAAVMFGAVTMGAAAATGNAPDPVREFLGVSDSVIRVEFTGTIVSIEGSTLTVDANGDLRTVVVDAATELSRGGDDIALADFAAGDPVEVKGRLQADNTVLASRVHLEDDVPGLATEPAGDGTVTPEPTGDPTDPTAVPAHDDDDVDEDDGDNNDCDNSGPGSPCDDDEDSTPSGAPTVDDGDDEGDDHSGPGGDDDAEEVDEDAVDADRSGPGSGSDDDAADDGSGSGSDDEPDDDSSGSGSHDEPDDSVPGSSG